MADQYADGNDNHKIQVSLKEVKNFKYWLKKICRDSKKYYFNNNGETKYDILVRFKTIDKYYHTVYIAYREAINKLSNFIQQLEQLKKNQIAIDETDSNWVQVQKISEAILKSLDNDADIKSDN